MNRLKRILNRLNKVKKQSEKKGKWFSFSLRFLKYLGFFLSGVFLGFNIYFSQNLPKNFFGLVEFQKKSVIEFLEKIQKTKYFFSQLKYFETLYPNEDLKKEVFKKEKEKKQMIKKLEQILEKNPKSHDVLYSLFLLTKDKTYLKKAQEIDPEIR